ncbi:hypothetical protein WMY93_022663 [Mugilogobius chulae]|uniref:Uncharacterized protein n=1 Tax=Mugilogobius chulae TaxID=88201 RepID=A0AAW0NEM5_9GOBI
MTTVPRRSIIPDRPARIKRTQPVPVKTRDAGESRKVQRREEKREEEEGRRRRGAAATLPPCLSEGLVVRAFGERSHKGAAHKKKPSECARLQGPTLCICFCSERNASTRSLMEGL